MITKEVLQDFYLKQGKSMQQIAVLLNCSLHKVAYWMEKRQVKRRSISDAIYLLNNPDGDPFLFTQPTTLEEAQLLGLGIGLYWGEGAKTYKTTIRLGNSDPLLINTFIDFLVKIFRIERNHLRFGLQIFNDLDPEAVLNYWLKVLNVPRSQFHKKIVITPSRAKGTYRKKSEYGVLTVYFHNKKFRDLLFSLMPR
ncbi:MAG: hypothetical protein WAP74_00825 [Patescibacteria group bacterium]